MIEQVPKVPGLSVAAVQDANLDTAAKVAERWAIPWYGERLEDLLDLPSVDAVVIATPNVFHVPQAQAALRAGKQVLVEKPLAVSAGDARATVDLAAARGRMLFVDYSYRLLDTAAALPAALAKIGSVRAMSAVFHNVPPGPPRPGREWFMDPRLSGGGVLLDLGVHMLDLALWLFRPRDARLERFELEVKPGFQVERNARVDLRFDEVPVSVEVSGGSPRPLAEISLVVDGAGGQLRWHNVEGSYAHFRTWLNERLLIEREITLRENTLRAFAAALASGSAPPIDTRVYDLIDQAYARG